MYKRPDSLDDLSESRTDAPSNRIQLDAARAIISNAKYMGFLSSPANVRDRSSRQNGGPCSYPTRADVDSVNRSHQLGELPNVPFCPHGPFVQRINSRSQMFRKPIIS
jgi:hypothetical protein